MYEELKKANFPILEDIYKKGRAQTRESKAKELLEFHLLVVVPIIKRRSKSYSPLDSRTTISPIFNSLLLHSVALPVSFSFPTTHTIVPVAMVVPWGNVIGPLNLGENNDLPRASRKNFQRFSSDGLVSIE